MRPDSHRLIRALVLLGLVLGAASPLSAQSVSPQIVVPQGQSYAYRHPEALARVAVGDPEVAEAIVLSPTEVLINGRSAGRTSFTLWSASGSQTSVLLEVVPDLEPFVRALRTLLPGERISVSYMGAAIVLHGTVTSPAVAARATEIVKASGSAVVNDLQLAEPRQVLLQVRFAEVSRTALRQFGANPGLSLIPDGSGSKSWAGSLSDALNLYLFQPAFSLQLFVDALQKNGVYRALAEPNLLAVEGREASFLAGGEFPYPVGNKDNVSVQFKEFGVRLNFTPSFTSSGQIRIKVAPEVSSLDFANGLEANGFRVPTVLSRRAETEVVLGDGQTFAIAGLIDRSVATSAEGLPFLGDLPVLGDLFRSKENRRKKTELLVLVTPRVVTPGQAVPVLPLGDTAQWFPNQGTPPR